MSSAGRHLQGWIILSATLAFTQIVRLASVSERWVARRSLDSPAGPSTSHAQFQWIETRSPTLTPSTKL